MQGSSTRRHRRRVVSLVALAASVALHLALIALLFPRRGAPPEGGRVVPFEVELRPAPAPPGAGRASRAPSGFRGFAPRLDPTSPPAVGAATPDALQRNVIRPEGIGAPALHGAPDLHVHWPGVPPDGGDLDVPPGGGDAVAAAPRDPLRDWAREQAGRARVDDGLVHPYYRDVGRAFLRAWDADRAVKKHGLSGYLAQAGDNLRTFGRVWQQIAEDFGRTGAPGLLDGGSARVKELSGLPAGPARDWLVQAEIRRQLGPAFSTGHVTLVRVTQSTDGRLLSVELVSPSNDAEIDRAAIEGVRTAALKLPVPPDDVRARREALTSMWEFELEISIAPPLPMIEVELDEVLGVGDLRLPLDRRIRKRVRLVAVM